MSTLEMEDKTKMLEDIIEDIKTEEKVPTPTDEKVSSAEGEDKSSKKQDYLQATIESKIKNAEGPPRRPIWEVLDDPEVRAIAERRAFLKKLRENAFLGRYRQEQQLRLNEMQMLRQQKREKRLEEQQRPLEVRPGFMSRVTNFFKDRTEKLISYLSEPNREVERIRQIERQSSGELKEVFKGAGTELRGASGFLRGLAAAAFKGIGEMSTKIGEGLESQLKQPLSSGVPARKPPGSL